MNTAWFLSLDGAGVKIEAWPRDCNTALQHTRVGGLALAEFTHRPGQRPMDTRATVSVA